ncbi:hypothetical protein LPJ74_000962 [Coemansia sp. RSA 1843]|nr:hypothetical protein LPJ74_000962 [Coemansia sp. RSA 1843]
MSSERPSLRSEESPSNNYDQRNDNNDGNSVRSNPPPSNYASDTLSRVSSSAQLKEFFPEDPHRRAQETASWGALRRFLHITFYEPSSMRARAYMAFSTCVVLLFLIVFMIDTFPQYRIRAHWRTIADTVNLATAVYFGLEWVLRFYSFRRRFRYLMEPMAIIDLLGIVPGFIYYTGDTVGSFGKVKWLRALQVLRVLRLLRLTEYSIELYVTVRTLKRSAGQILIVMMVIVSLLLTACFLLFFAENDSLDEVNVQWMRKAHGVTEVSPFQNVFFCLYWGFVTITTVGYGDYTPVSPWGQVIACLTMLMGVFTIVFPTSIISNNFATEWEAFRKAQKLHEHRKLQREYERKRRGLEKAWSYATHTYNDTNNNNNNIDIDTQTYENNLEMSGEEMPVATQVHYEDQPPHHTMRSPFSYDTAQDRGDTTDPESVEMGPLEYGRIVDIGKKVEHDLGIPGAAINDINSDNSVNKNLAISAMYSKLYNDAFTSLCERMLGRMIEYNGLVSIDEIVEFLQRQPSSRNFVRSWPHNKRLSVLEHKLLCYVLERIKTRRGSVYQDEDSSGLVLQEHINYTKSGATSRAQSPGHGQSGLQHLSGSRPPSVRHGKGIRRRLKSKLKHVYDYIPPSSHGSSAQTSLHDYISSSSHLKSHHNFASQAQMRQRRTYSSLNTEQDDNHRNAMPRDANMRSTSKTPSSPSGDTYEQGQKNPSNLSSEIVIDVPPSETENSDSIDSKGEHK